VSSVVITFFSCPAQKDKYQKYRWVSLLWGKGEVRPGARVGGPDVVKLLAALGAYELARAGGSGAAVFHPLQVAGYAVCWGSWL
jgi:hypothetical protein